MFENARKCSGAAGAVAALVTMVVLALGLLGDYGRGERVARHLLEGQQAAMPQPQLACAGPRC